MRKLLASFFFLGILSVTYAQIDSTKTVELENIIIQGNRINFSFKESSRNISVMSDVEIKNLPAQSISEILTYIPGVDIRQRGPVGVQADIGIRGGTFEQTLVLINGIKLTDPQTGHHSLNVPVNFSNLKRIEVLKGPGARIYGQNAFSGAVNFITSVPENRYAGIRLYGGQHKLFGGTFDLSLPSEKYNQYISYSHDASD
jgi:iron complex outermembrane receptor protein